MIDLHCHLLPGIDDGPATMDQSLAMARHAEAAGIRRAVVTPHIIPGRYDNTVDSIRAVFETFRATVQAAGIELDLAFAAEVRISPEIMAMESAGTLPVLGEIDGYRILLLEMPHSHIPPGSERMIEWLMARNIRPMIAHPERNKDVIRRGVGMVEPFVKAGCFLQLTAGAVAGQFGPVAAERAREMLEREWVTILASDAHNLEHRPPEIEPGRGAAERIVGEGAARALTEDVPATLCSRLFA